MSMLGYGDWHRRYTRSTASFALKDVPIGVRCGIVLGEKTPTLSLMVLWSQKNHLFCRHRQMMQSGF